MKPTIYFPNFLFNEFHSAYSQNINGLIQSSENGVERSGSTHPEYHTKYDSDFLRTRKFFLCRGGEIGDTLIVSNINFYHQAFYREDKKNRISILF